MVCFSGSKKSANAPFCDGTHSKLVNRMEIVQGNKVVEISQAKSFLTTALRNEIPHLSACGGIGKCTTCRVEILSGLEFCSERTEEESKLANKLSMPDSIRMACQIKINGDVKIKRLLLDKRDLTLNNELSKKKEGTVGTIRNLTILFCDIKGLTPFSESLSVYDVIFILNRYFSIMREVIISNGGEVNNYIGDAILAIFGLKESRQQTIRAIKAALQMLIEMDNFQKYLEEAYDESLISESEFISVKSSLGT